LFWLLWYECGMVLAAAAVRNVAELCELSDAGEQPEYLMFWGHRPSADGGVGRGCLSQWWPAPFTVDGVVYPTAEHFMMASKALLFGDSGAAEQIVRAADPGAAKALGRQVRGFDEQVWAGQRFGVVVVGNLAKFSQHPQLGQFLLASGDLVLAEASPRDRVWGIGLAAGDERAASPRTWQGSTCSALRSWRSAIASRSTPHTRARQSSWVRIGLVETVVQWVHTSWTKLSRGGVEASRRNAAPAGFQLPAVRAPFVHEVSMAERDEFQPRSQTYDGEWTYRLDTPNVAHGPVSADMFLGTPTHHIKELAPLR